MPALALALLAAPLQPLPAPAQAQAVATEDYAACLAQRHARELSAALDKGFDAVFDAALAQVPTAGCDATGVAGVAAAKLRGPLFAAMYRRYAPRAGSSASNFLLESGWVPALAPGDERAGWYAVSNCLAKKEFNATRALILAKPGSKAVGEQLANVIAALPQCLPAGQEFKVGRAVLTGLIAETVYQIDFATLNGEPKQRFWSRF